jgi:hypothetical protein
VKLIFCGKSPDKGENIPFSATGNALISQELAIPNVSVRLWEAGEGGRRQVVVK